MRKKRQLVLFLFLLVVILLISFAGAETFGQKIGRITGFSVYGNCQGSLSKDPAKVTSARLIGCLDYCDEYEDYNLGTLAGYEDERDICYLKSAEDLINNTIKYANCTLTYGNESKECKSYLKKVNSLTAEKDKCDKKFDKKAAKYQNIVENCQGVEESMMEENPAIYQLYQSYLKAQGTNCIKTEVKNAVWNPVADINKDGKVDKKDKKLILENVNNITWAGIFYQNEVDYCEFLCLAAGGVELCQQDEACPKDQTLTLAKYGGVCCKTMCDSCSDSDLSIEREYIDFGMFTFGNVTDKNDKFKEDACGKESALKEQYCSTKGTASTMKIKCPSNSCENGACVPDKCSDGINSCAVGISECSTGELDCACIPPGYYQEAKDIEDELKEPFKERRKEIKEELEEGPTAGFLALFGSIPPSVVDPEHASEYFEMNLKIAVITAASVIIGPEVLPVIESVVGTETLTYLMAIYDIGSIAKTGSDIVSSANEVQPLSVKGKNIIRELGWLKDKIDSIKVEVVCDEYEGKVYLECTGSSKCSEKERILYPEDTE